MTRKPRKRPGQPSWSKLTDIGCRDGRAHHWVINSPNGSEIVAALCLHCGVERTYAAGWSRDGSALFNTALNPEEEDDFVPTNQHP